MECRGTCLAPDASGKDSAGDSAKLIWETLVTVVVLASPLPIAVLLLDGSRKKCPSCGKMWARTMVETHYTSLTPTNEYMHWRVFFDNHFVGFAPESAIPRQGSSNAIQVYACRFCHEPFSKLPGSVQPRTSLILKLGLIMLAAFFGDLAALITLGENIALEVGAVYLLEFSAILISTGLVLQFIGKELG
jgi:hypothetical protein